MARISEERVSVWDQAKQNSAMAQGWRIAANCTCIQRHDDLERFDSDAAAQAFVAHRAILGDELAKAAWLYLSWCQAVSDAADDSDAA